MSTSVERAELLYDGGGSEEPERKEWFDGRLGELMTSTTAVMEALDDGQCIELLEALLRAIHSPHARMETVLGAMAQYLDHVVYLEEQRGEYDEWRRSMKDSYDDSKESA